MVIVFLKKKMQHYSRFDTPELSPELISAVETQVMVKSWLAHT